jgi:phage-related minor tail protein/phosphotransferase system HPr-like phosphotransfer protein
VADRTVRAIFEARVDGAKKNIIGFGKDVDTTGKKVDGLTKDLETLDKVKVNPKIDLEIDEVQREVADLKAEIARLDALEATPEVLVDWSRAQVQLGAAEAALRELTEQRAEVRVTASIDDAQKRLRAITAELGELHTLEVTPEVTADIAFARRRLNDVKAELRDLNGAKAVMQVTADTDQARSAIDGLADDVADAGADGGDEAGQNIVSGILDALRTIPIAGAVIGVGVAIGAGILLGIQRGLSVEAERDLFSAQTGLDEDTSARFGRAAGEAYANAWGDSVAANLETARFALQAGIIDADATDAEVESVIAKLQGLSDLFQYDIAESVRGVGNLMKTGLVKDADQAFDLIVKSSQKVQSDDLIDTINEYSNQFVTLGLTAEQAFGLITQGVAAGARDTDNIADSLKEMGLRIREGTKPAIDALEMLGLNAKDIVTAFQKGGPDAVAGMDKVFDALRKLEEKGGNAQAVIAALFGGPGEDLGAALYALDVEKAAEALAGVEGAAGAADRALQTMSDNTATRMEEAKRNVEIAMDGIKGALAEAFGDDISGAAEWVKMNRAPLLQFFLDVVNGAFDMADAFTQFGATGLEVIAELAIGFATLLDAIPTFIFDGEAAADGLRSMAEGARDAADTLRTDVPNALDEVRDKANDWAAPEILKARVHDATLAMTADLENFVAAAGESDIDVKINGDTVNAEEALAVLIDNINAEDGTVLINGDPVPAEDALGRLLEFIEQGEADVTVGADTGPADVSLTRYKGRVSASEAAITVYANTKSAEAALKELERTRYATLQIRVAGVNAPGGLTRHDGGWITIPGLHAGGKVPGTDPGYDNVLWPLHTGGQTLVQPLAGGEYVVNSKDASFWGPVLELMNSGARPTMHQVTNDNGLHADTVNILTPDADSFKRDLKTTAYRAKARPGR